MTEAGAHRLYGKYRGRIMDTRDPEQLGRVRAQIPAIDGAEANWALPCAPYGAALLLPPLGASVWIEFEAGDPNYPIWSGCFWTNAADVPIAAGPPLPTSDSGPTGPS